MLGWQILVLAAEKSSGGEMTPVMHIPLFIPVFLFGCCMSLFALTLLVNCLEKFRALRCAGKSRNIPAVLLITALAAALPWILESASMDISRSQLGVFGMLGFMLILFLLSSRVRHGHFRIPWSAVPEPGHHRPVQHTEPDFL